jgi:tetratricopeptide (TPR) repeat protein
MPARSGSFWTMVYVFFLSNKATRQLPLFEDMLKRQVAKRGRQPPDTQTTVANLGVNYRDAGWLEEAIPLLEEADQAAKNFAALRWVANPLINAYAKAGEHAKLADLLQEQLAQARKSLPKDRP